MKGEELNTYEDEWRRTSVLAVEGMEEASLFSAAFQTSASVQTPSRHLRHSRPFDEGFLPAEWLSMAEGGRRARTYTHAHI